MPYQNIDKARRAYIKPIVSIAAQHAPEGKASYLGAEFTAPIGGTMGGPS